MCSYADGRVVLEQERFSVVVDIHNTGFVSLRVGRFHDSFRVCGEATVVLRVQYHACSGSNEWYEVFAGRLSAHRLAHVHDFALPQFCGVSKCTPEVVEGSAHAECVTWNDSVKARMLMRMEIAMVKLDGVYRGLCWDAVVMQHSSVVTQGLRGTVPVLMSAAVEKRS